MLTNCWLHNCWFEMLGTQPLMNISWCGLMGTQQWNQQKLCCVVPLFLTQLLCRPVSDSNPLLLAGILLLLEWKSEKARHNIHNTYTLRIKMISSNVEKYRKQSNFFADGQSIYVWQSCSSWIAERRLMGGLIYPVCTDVYGTGTYLLGFDGYAFCSL